MGGKKWRGVTLSFVVCLGVVMVVGMVGSVGATSEQPSGQSIFVSSQNTTISLNAEAGLDRTVGQYETVYLDAGESTARYGEITSYDWEITHPDGSTSTPECTACQQPRFVPESPGTYSASVTVTDTDGNQASDTLYVEVSQRDPPTAEIGGVSSAEPGTTEELDVVGTPGTNSLLSVEWSENGRHQSSVFLDDNTATSYQAELPLPGIYTIGAAIVDNSGLSAQDEQQVEVGEEYSHFVVTIDETTAPVERGETMAVETTVENQGNLADTQPIVLETPDGIVHTETNSTLEPGEKQQVTLDWNSCDRFHREVTALSQDDADSTLVEVQGGQCDDDTQFEIEQFDAPSEATEGDTVETTAVVTNAGEDTAEQVVTLEDIYGRYTAAGTKTVELQPGESRELSLNWESRVGEAGSGALTMRTESDERTSSFELQSMAEFDISFDETELPEDRSDDDLVATVDVANAGSASDTQPITLETDGLHIDETDLTLSGMESDSVTLRWDGAAHAGGTHDLLASSDDATATETVEIPEQEAEEESGSGADGSGGGGGSGPSYERHAQLNGLSSTGGTMEPGDSAGISLDSVNSEIQAYEPRVGSVQYDGSWICDPSNNHCDWWDEDKWPTLDTYSESAHSTNADTAWDGYDPALMTRDGGIEPEFELDDDYHQSYEGDSGTIEITSQADYDSANELNFNGNSITTTIDWEVPEEDDDDDSGGTIGSPGGGSGGDDDDEEDDDSGGDDDEDDSGDDGGDDDEQDPCDINPDNPDCNGDDGGDDDDDEEEDDDDDDDDDGGGGGGGGGFDPCPGDVCLAP